MNLNFEKIDVEEFLNEMGVLRVRKNGNEVTFACPFGTHRRGGAISMQQGTTIFNCFGCGIKGNIITFLSELEGITPSKAKTMLREKYDIYDDIDEDNFLRQVTIKVENSEKKRTKEYEEFDEDYPILDESELLKREVDWYSAHKAYFIGQECYPFSYMFDRGFDPGVLTYWQIGWDQIEQMFTIPYRDDGYNLVGFKGRALEGRIPKYKVLGGDTLGFPVMEVSQHLFGLFQVATSGEYDRVIIREGELNTIAFHQSGINNVIGISGSYVSDKQKKLILDNFKYVAFSFDDIKSTKAAVRELRDHIPVGYFPYNEKDPADMTHIERMEYVSTIKSGILL